MPTRGYEEEAGILSGWLGGFDAAAIARAVRLDAGQASDKAAALVEKAALAFDQKWDHILFYPGRGCIAPTIRLWSGATCTNVASLRQKGGPPRLQQEMARMLARSANAFMHVSKEGVTKHYGVRKRIGPAASVFVRNMDPGTLELPRMLATLPDGAHL